MVDKLALGQVFLQVLRFLSVTVIAPVLQLSKKQHSFENREALDGRALSLLFFFRQVLRKMATLTRYMKQSFKRR